MPEQHLEKASWYSQPVDELLATLDSSPGGLTEAVAAARLEKYGPNELEFRKTPPWVRFLRQF